jgi:hypothetical protein
MTDRCSFLKGLNCTAGGILDILNNLLKKILQKYYETFKKNIYNKFYFYNILI